jgi:hypothetical protein
MTSQINLTHLDPDKAVQSFFADPDWRMNTAIGATFNALAAVVLVFNVMLLPVFFLFWAVVCGYHLRVLRSKIVNPSASLPEWGDWVDLIISGLTWLAVVTGFGFVIVSIPTISLLIGAAQGSMVALHPHFLEWSMITFSLTFVMALFVGLLLTFLQANFAKEERMSAAFAFREVSRRLRQNGVPLVCAWLLSIGLTAAAVVIPMCTIVGIFLIPTALFIAGTISATMVAQAWSSTDAVAGS